MKKIEIKGKEYVQVNERVLEFKLQFPKGRIITDVISHEDGKVVMKTSVYADDTLPLYLWLLAGRMKWKAAAM